jgi:hypothetical protein
VTRPSRPALQRIVQLVVQQSVQPLASRPAFSQSSSLQLSRPLHSPPSQSFSNPLSQQVSRPSRNPPNQSFSSPPDQSQRPPSQPVTNASSQSVTNPSSQSRGGHLKPS